MRENESEANDLDPSRGAWLSGDRRPPASPVAITTDGRESPTVRVFRRGRLAEILRAVPVLVAEVVKSYPHDPHAFTQGLEYYDGYLYESTGRSGQSTLAPLRSWRLAQS